MNIHEDLEWLSTTDMGQGYKKGNEKSGHFCVVMTKQGMTGLWTATP